MPTPRGRSSISPGFGRKSDYLAGRPEESNTSSARAPRRPRRRRAQPAMSTAAAVTPPITAQPSTGGRPRIRELESRKSDGVRAKICPTEVRPPIAMVGTRGTLPGANAPVSGPLLAWARITGCIVRGSEFRRPRRNPETDGYVLTSLPYQCSGIRDIRTSRTHDTRRRPPPALRYLSLHMRIHGRTRRRNTAYQYGGDSEDGRLQTRFPAMDRDPPGFRYL
jgi:hypothetical protein